MDPGFQRPSEFDEHAGPDVAARLLEVAPVVMFAWSIDGSEGAHRFFMSSNAASLLGRLPVDIDDLSDLLHELVLPEDRPELREGWSRSLSEDPASVDVEARLRSDGESHRWVRITSAVHPDDAKLIVGFIWDVTDLVTANRSERRARAVAERRRDRALAANRAKTEFLSRMSHELRTPLNSIVGFGQLLEMQDLGPTENEWVAHVVEAGKHLLGLINEVLDVAGIEAGKLFLSIESVDLLEVIEQASASIRPAADERSITLEVTSIDRHLWVLADRQRVLQIVLNLLSNAVRYNREAGAIAVSAAREHDRVRLTVADTGIGIAEDLWRRVFEPFDRLGVERLGIEGTGMGMALSRSLAERMDGTLDIVSANGDGSTFTLVLPAALRPGGRKLEAVPRVRPSIVRLPAAESTLTVLYIEDNVTTLRLMESVLRLRPPVTLVSAMSGEAGLEIARDQRPDLIMVDLHLPDIDGTEVVRRVREDPTTTATPVAVVSADATAETIEALTEVGADYYWTKPIDIEELIGTVDQLLDRKRTRRA